jgi:hypothetical protein
MTLRIEMIMRDSYQFPETLEEVLLVVKTLSPTKWLLVDRETGQIYQGNASGHWDKLEPKVR